MTATYSGFVRAISLSIQVSYYEHHKHLNYPFNITDYLRVFMFCFIRASGTVYTAIDIATGQEVKPHFSFDFNTSSFTV